MPFYGTLAAGATGLRSESNDCAECAPTSGAHLNRTCQAVGTGLAPDANETLAGFEIKLNTGYFALDQKAVGMKSDDIVKSSWEFNATLTLGADMGQPLGTFFEVVDQAGNVVAHAGGVLAEGTYINNQNRHFGKRCTAMNLSKIF